MKCESQWTAISMSFIKHHLDTMWLQIGFTSFQSTGMSKQMHVSWVAKVHFPSNTSHTVIGLLCWAQFSLFTSALSSNWALFSTCKWLIFLSCKGSTLAFFGLEWCASFSIFRCVLFPFLPSLSLSSLAPMVWWADKSGLGWWLVLLLTKRHLRKIFIASALWTSFFVFMSLVSHNNCEGREFKHRVETFFLRCLKTK